MSILTQAIYYYDPLQGFVLWVLRNIATNWWKVYKITLWQSKKNKPPCFHWMSSFSVMIERSLSVLNWYTTNVIYFHIPINEFLIRLDCVCFLVVHELEDLIVVFAVHVRFVIFYFNSGVNPRQFDSIVWGKRMLLVVP